MSVSDNEKPILQITMDDDGDVVFGANNLDIQNALFLLEVCRQKIVAEYMRGIFQNKLAEQQRREALTAPLYVPSQKGVITP